MDQSRNNPNIQFEHSNSQDYQDQSASCSGSCTLNPTAHFLGAHDLPRVLTNWVQYIRKKTITVLLRPDTACTPEG
ncbi:uncharacterized protein VP01_1841g10 [Puccinia sorghi]|uniref:Uncharacterized protein n=1 Tax=Puccinia sorghi TaxID=27349 RepID=A0A0L6VEA8_9BASI|nr:uncharacterized protein VP01_1841g10 [Puccinia sorghi]